MEEKSGRCSKHVQEEGELPLHEYVVASRLVKNRAYHRALLLLCAALFLLFIAYRLHYSCHGALALAALACEVCFCITFLLSLCFKWFTVERVAHPDRLLSRCTELPRVDVFVTTTDPIREPPLIIVNTVLSVLALDYPTHKLACYISDDGGSLLTLWALKEAVSFAKSWVPFCKQFSPYIYPRAPGPFFAHKRSAEKAEQHGFIRQWNAIKEEYDALETKIRCMSEAYSNSEKETLKLVLTKLLASTTLDGNKATYLSWTMDYDPRNHSSHCETLWDTNMELPYLVYMSREKRPKKEHHFKAGAMNTLLRISGIMTNAPYVLNLDCDMYVNEAKALLQAMCFFMQNQDDKSIGFVQFRQWFEGVDEDDIYGGQAIAIIEIFLKGLDGVQGPTYTGAGCVHKRESLYGKIVYPNSSQLLKHGSNLENMFGNCQVLLLNAQSILSNQSKNQDPSLMQDALMTESIALMDCTYEDNTSWGKEVGLIYGSVTEDLMTSIRIHSRGWKSVFYAPFPPTFIGCVPSTSEDALTMRKRWYMGILEILFSPYAPFLVKNTKGLSLIQRLIYSYFIMAVFSFLAFFIYSILPSLAILGKRKIYPQALDSHVVIPLSLSMCIYISKIYENKMIGVGMKQWWNNEQMDYISAVSSSVLAAYEVMKNKVMGLSETTFVVTPKDQNAHLHDASQDDGDDKKGLSEEGFVVNSTLPIFMLPTILVLLNMTSIVVASMHTINSLIMLDTSLSCLPPIEIVVSMWVLFALQPFSKGFLFWALGQRGPLALSSSCILHSSIIVMALLSLALYF